MNIVGIKLFDKYGRPTFDSYSWSSVRWLGVIELDGKTSGSVVNNELSLGDLVTILLHTCYLTENEFSNGVNKVFSYPKFSKNGSTLSWTYSSETTNYNTYPAKCRYGVILK